MGGQKGVFVHQTFLSITRFLDILSTEVLVIPLRCTLRNTRRTYSPEKTTMADQQSSPRDGATHRSPRDDRSDRGGHRRSPSKTGKGRRDLCLASPRKKDAESRRGGMEEDEWGMEWGLDYVPYNADGGYNKISVTAARQGRGGGAGDTPRPARRFSADDAFDAAQKATVKASA